MSKLALGTAQFGMDYGINNKTGKIPIEEAARIMDLALENDVDLFDTASSYGESEKVIGSYFSGKNEAASIVSKLNAKTKDEASGMIETTLKNLGSKMIYGYLLHDFNSYRNDPSIYTAIIDAKKAGKIKKTGFSLYYPSEIEYLLNNNVQFDLIQVPLNIFDQRFKGYLPALKKKGIEMHIRSIFLQGLVFKRPFEVKGFFAPIKDKLEALYKLSGESGVSVLEICLGYAVMDPNIDRIIIGVDSRENLSEILLANSEIKAKRRNGLFDNIQNLSVSNEAMILPFMWKGMNN